MSVLIKMEMPTSCFECRFSIDGFCYASGHVNIKANEERQITNYCPLVPIPPHGRLIDADAMSQDETVAFISAQEKLGHDVVSWQVNTIVHAKIQKLIDDTPTIIPEDNNADD